MITAFKRTSWLLALALASAPAGALPPVASVWLYPTSFAGEFAIRRGIAAAFPNARVRVLDSIDLQIADELPDLIVHSMSNARDTDKLIELRARSGGQTSLLIFEDPHVVSSEIDVIVSPRHLPPVLSPYRNVLRLDGVPTPVTPAALAEARARNRFAILPRPRVLALVAGQTGQLTFTSVRATELGRRLRGLARGGSFLLSNSRRTPETPFAALREAAAADVVVDVRAGDQNPYLDLLAAADYVVVTADSSSMIADALETGKPVYLFAPRELMEDRHLRFNLPLVERGVVRLLGDRLESWEYVTPDVRGVIRAEVERRRGCTAALAPSGAGGS